MGAGPEQVGSTPLPTSSSRQGPAGPGELLHKLLQKTRSPGMSVTLYSPHSAFTPSMLAQGASCPHGTFGKVSDVPGCQQLGMEALLLASRGQSQGGCKTSTCTGQASTGLSSPKGPQGGSRETRLHTDGLLLLGPAEVGTTISIPRRREAWR